MLQAKLQSSSHLLVGRSRASQDSLNGEADGEIQELATPGQAGLSLPEATAHHVLKFPGSAALPRLLPCHWLMLQEAGGIKRAGATVLHENMGCKTNDLGYPEGGWWAQRARGGFLPLSPHSRLTPWGEGAGW